jgi:hypothetical protein
MSEESRADRDGKTPAPGAKNFTTANNFDAAGQWGTQSDGKSKVVLESAKGMAGAGLKLESDLGEGGWVVIARKSEPPPGDDAPLVFLLKGTGPADLEIKWIDKDQSVFGRRVSLSAYADWTPVVVHPGDLEYWWGGDDKNAGLDRLEFAVSGKGSGSACLDEIGWGRKNWKSTLAPAGPLLDPDADRSGIGFRQRRSKELVPENKLVLEWLKQVQDLSSPEQALMPSQEDNSLNLFNQALVAMAFMVKDERERAERILDFFAKSTKRDNEDPNLQNFFYKGEARGFFQNFNLRADGGQPACHQTGNSDRWMGDMAWLLIACKYYEQKYDSDRYREITGLLKDLLVGWFKEEGAAGYVQHGWRGGDSRLHESFGHPEGNIDCYAAFILCGENERAKKIRAWLDQTLKGKNLPLDLYTWRVLAYGPEAAEVLNIPEYDLRYRKTVMRKGEKVAGFFHAADPVVNNIWLDGTGHIACAYLTQGDTRRGNFYANQLDAFLIKRTLDGVETRALPYTANKEGGYDWVGRLVRLDGRHAVQSFASM